VGEDGGVIDPSSLLLLVLGYGALGLKVWALVDACTRPQQAYVATGKLTKIAWVAILAAAVLLGGADVFGIFGLLGTVAAIVYLVDVRPAVRELRRGGPWA
jgi:hypothetical protein